MDWYNPLPQKYRSVRAEILIPTELLVGVYPSRISEATALLGDSDITEITDGQAKQISSIDDPEKALELLLEKRLTKLRFSRAYPPTKRTLSDDAWEQIQKSESRITATLEKDIRMYGQWKGRLRPYLIKGVSLNGGTAPFFGGMVSETLFLTYVGIGDRLVPMNRMPVVAYLPKKPKRVYHDATMMQ